MVIFIIACEELNNPTLAGPPNNDPGSGFRLRRYRERLVVKTLPFFQKNIYVLT